MEKGWWVLGGSVRMRRCDPHRPPQEGGCPNVLPPAGPRRSGRLRRLPCVWGSQTQTAVPAVSERRLLGAEGDKPGLSAGTGGLVFPVSGLEGASPPPSPLQGCSPASAATSKGAPPTSGVAEQGWGEPQGTQSQPSQRAKIKEMKVISSHGIEGRVLQGNLR